VILAGKAPTGGRSPVGKKKIRHKIKKENTTQAIKTQKRGGSGFNPGMVKSTRFPKGKMYLYKSSRQSANPAKGKKGHN